MEKIFNSKETLESSGNMLSFKDCPNRCIDGYYVDPYRHKRVKCLYCEQKRIDIARNKIDVLDMSTNKNIEKSLNLPSYVNGINFDVNSLIDKKDESMIEEKSLQEVKDSLEELLNMATIGDLPDYSLCINLGRKAHKDNLVYPWMLRLYMSGVSLSPYISSKELSDLRENYGFSEVAEELGISYKDLLKRDGCFVFLDAGSTDSDINAVKGLMELRASKNKVTIVIIGLVGGMTKRISTDDKVKDLGYYLSVEYKPQEFKGKNGFNNKNTYSSKSANSSSNEISSDMMKNLMSSHNNI